MLDLLLNLKSDKSQAAQIAKEMEQNLKNINPKISIDSDKFRKGITDILGEFDKLEKSALDFDKILSNIDIDFDSDQAEQAMKKLAEMMKNAGDNLGDLDLSKFEEALGSLGDEDIEQIGEKLKEAFDNFDANSLKKQIKGIEDETELMKLNVEKATAEYNKQRSTVALLAKAGKENTDEYKEALAELKKRGDELKKIKKAEEDIGKAVEGTKEKMSVMNKLSQFGLASEGIQNFAQSVNDVSAPFMELDKATQAMKTLGPEAKELSGELRTVSVQMAKDLPFSAGQFQEAMGNAMASGIKGGVEGLSGFAETAAKLATGGMAELPAVVQGLGATLNAFGASSSEAGQYADWMFNIVNAGVTTIDELNQYLSGVTPTAASMGVAFKDVGGALALMTQKGVPTASAVTKLNAALIEMAKPSAGIQQALTAVGISTEDFAKQIKEKGLTSALQTLDSGFKKLGKSATQMFSSSEAGAAFNVLMGDVNMLNDTMDAVANTAGSTQAAYDEMAQSIEVRTKQMKAQFDSFVISVIDSTGVIGEYTMVAGQVFSQLSPTITALAGFKTLLPTEAIGDFVKSLLTKLVPGLFATAAAETAAGTAGTTAGASTAAAWAAAMLPLLAIVAVAGAIVGAFKLIADATHETAKEQLESAKATEDSLKSQQKTLQAQKERKQANLELIKSYEELGKKSNRTKDEEEQFRQMQVKISQAFPGVISGSKTFAENMANLKNAVEKGKGEVQKLDKQLSELDKNLVKARTVTLQSEVNVSKENIEDQLQDAFSSVSWSWDGAQEWIFGTSNAREMAEDSIKQYTDAIYQAQNSSQLAEAGAKFKMALWNDKAFEAVPEEMKSKLVGSIEDMMLKQGAVIDQQNKLNTEKMQKGIKEAFKDGVVSEADIKAISDKTKVPLEEVQKYYDELKTKAKAEKLGDILKQSAEIKGNLDGSQKLDELVKQFENAKTDVEKASIAEAIKKQAPDAIKATGSVITAEGKLVNTYSVVTDKIKESSDAQKERFSNNLVSKQQEFINTILQESDAYGKNIEEMNRLKAERDKLASQGLDTSKIDQQINALGAKNQAFTNEVLNNIIKWESQGQDTTEVYDQVAKSLGKSPEEVKKLVEQQKLSIQQADKETSSVEKLAEAWGKATAAAQKNVSDGEAALAEMRKRRRELLSKSQAEWTMDDNKFMQEYNQKYSEMLGNTRKAVKETKQVAKEEELIGHLTGRIVEDKKSAYELAKEQADKEKSILELKNQEKILDDEALRMAENRQESVWDNLVLERDKLEMLEAQKASLEKAFQITKDQSGKLVIGIKAGKGEKKSEIDEAVTEEINNINQSIKEAKNSVNGVKIQIELDKKEIEKQLAEYEMQKTIHQIELGIKGTEEFDNLIALTKKQVDLSKDELESSNNAIDELKKKMEKELIGKNIEDAQRQDIHNKYNILLLEEQRRNIELSKNVDEAESKVNEIVEKKYNFRLQKLNEFYDRQKEVTEKSFEDQKDIADSFSKIFVESLNKVTSSNDDSELKKFESKQEERLKLLDDYKNAELFSEEEYQARKTDIEKKGEEERARLADQARRKELSNQAYINGIEEQHQRAKEAKLLAIERNRETAKLKLLEDSTKEVLATNKTNFEEVQKLQRELLRLENEQVVSGYDEKRAVEMQAIQANLDSKLAGLTASDKVSLKQMTESFDKLNIQLEDKTSMLNLVLDKATEAYSEGFARLFAGDPQAAADVLRKSFSMVLGTMAEALKKEVDAKILKFFLDWFDSAESTALPWFVRLGMLPLVQGIASGAIHGIADPIIESIASFSTGGRIDEPTLAVVGDASRLGGLNREWVFRDEQLQQVVNSALSQQNNSMARELAEIKALLASQELSATLKGNDIRLAQRRTQNAVDRRAR